MTISQRNVRARRPQATLGELVESSRLNRCATLINKAPQAQQVDDVTVDSAADATEYAYSVNGVEVKITSGAGATVTSIANKLIAAHNANPLIRGQVRAELEGADKVRLTGLEPGVAFTLSEDDARLSTASVVSPAEADPIPFGRLLISTGYVPEEANELCALAQAARLTAQVDQLEVPYVASVEYFVGVRVDGAEYRVASTADTDQDTTITNLAAALNAVLPANTVAVTDDDSGADDATTLIFTAELAGKPFEVFFGSSDDGASHPAFVHTTNRGVLTDINRAAAAISVRRYDQEASAPAVLTTTYQPNEGVEGLEDGAIWVDSPGDVSFGEEVWVELGSSNAGRLYAASSATRVKLEGARWLRPARGDDALAALRFERAL